jgi:hypothetical protein
VVQEEPQRGVRFDLGGVSQLTFWRKGWIIDPVIFIFYFVRLPLCNKYSDYIVTFSSIHSVIIYVVFFGACMRCIRLCPLKPGCDMVLPPASASARYHQERVVSYLAGTAVLQAEAEYDSRRDYSPPSRMQGDDDAASRRLLVQRRRPCATTEVSGS